MEPGRFFVTPAGHPYYNMAFDEWAFSRMGRNAIDSPAVIHLYSWRSPGITIGYNQRYERAVDRSRLDPGVPVIRRITGGRAIYHDDLEITFSLILDMAALFAAKPSLAEVNELISEAVLDTLKSLSIEASIVDGNALPAPAPVADGTKACFMSPTRYEIVTSRSKLVGGAQRRIDSCLIHQGSLKVNGVTACSAIGQEDGSQGRERVLGVNDFIRPMIASFSAKLALDFHRSRLHPAEAWQLDLRRRKLEKKPLEKRGFD